MADNYQKALKKLYIVTFKKHLQEQKYTYSVLLWFIILIGFGIYYADRL